MLEFFIWSGKQWWKTVTRKKNKLEIEASVLHWPWLSYIWIHKSSCMIILYLTVTIREMWKLTIFTIRIFFWTNSAFVPQVSSLHACDTQVLPVLHQQLQECLPGKERWDRRVGTQNEHRSLSWKRVFLFSFRLGGTHSFSSSFSSLFCT